MPSKEAPSGSCEKTGGGEWTALRERLVVIQLEHETKYEHRPSGAWLWNCSCGAAGQPDSWEGCHQKTREHWADLMLEALAAAAPAPPAPFAYVCPANCGCMWRDNGDFTMSLFGIRSESCQVCEPLGLKDLIPVYVAPPPQDGQGAELLGPPRGGSSSDLAGPSNLGAVARQAREYYKTLLNNANMCAAAWLIHEAPIVTEVPSKAEREVATATTNLSVAEAIGKRCDECEWHGCVGRHNGCGCGCHVTEMIEGQARLDGAVAGNASAPVDDCFGDPWVWSEGADHSDALASNDWILIKAPALRVLVAREVGEPLREILDDMERHLKAWATNEATGLVKGPAANATWLLKMVRKALALVEPREVGEGLREARLLKSWLTSWDDGGIVVNELRTEPWFEHNLVEPTRAALAAPASKPAPPAEPDLLLIKQIVDEWAVDADGRVHIHKDVISKAVNAAVRRAAERKPPR